MSTDPRDFPNPDHTPTFGFIRHQFTPKRRCVKCRRKIYVGIVNIHAPEGSVLCLGCYDSLDDERPLDTL